METLEELHVQLNREKKKYDDLSLRYEELSREYEAMQNSKSWKLTKPLRLTGDFLRMLHYKKGSGQAFGSELQSYYHTNTFLGKWLRKHSCMDRNTAKELFLFSEETLQKQKQQVFPRSVKISVLVPLYNTPKQFLKEMIESVLAQTYGNWELCLADGSDEEHSLAGKICLEYTKKDSRIHYKKLEKNLGISGNTNACLDMATGDYIALFDHDDLLHPAAFFEVMRYICGLNADFLYTDEAVFTGNISCLKALHYKPDFAPDTLRSNNYICHLTVFKASLLKETGGFRPECDGSQDYDMVLRLTEKAGKIVHIPEVLYFWRCHPGSVADSIGAKPYVLEAARRALRDHLTRVGLEGEVSDSPAVSCYKIRYQLQGTPLISLLIPNYEHLEDLKKCLNSVYGLSTYRNFEIIIIENNSKDPALFDYYKEMQERHRNLQVVVWNHEEEEFNYSALNNFGAGFAKGDYLLLLNNDTEVLSPDWLEQMLMLCQRNDIGAVGAKLYYPDNTVQHAGVVLGIGGTAGHIFKGSSRRDPGYIGRLSCVQNYSAVTGACLMLPKALWNQLGGLNEAYKVAFNDVDLCMRIRRAGYLIAWTPFAELYHYESKSRGYDDVGAARQRFLREKEILLQDWKAELDYGDPYFNPNFSLDCEQISFDNSAKARERLARKENILFFENNGNSTDKANTL